MIASVVAKIRTERLPITGLDPYRYTNLLGWLDSSREGSTWGTGLLQEQTC
jgi:hypothetical protein